MTLADQIAYLTAELAKLKRAQAETEPLLTVAQAAEYLAMTPAAVRQSVYRGTLTGVVRVGKRLRFRRAELGRT